MMSEAGTAPVVSLDAIDKCCFAIAIATTVTPNPKARTPSFLLTLELSPALAAEHLTLHRKPAYASSAQLAAQHAPEDVAGAALLALLNFPRKQIGRGMSDCLVTGAVPPPGAPPAGAVFVRPHGAAVPPGTRVGVRAADAPVEANARDLTWGEFAALDVRVGTVLSVVKVADAEGGLRRAELLLDFGGTQRAAEVLLHEGGVDTGALVGRQVLAVCNATPPEDPALVLTAGGRAVLEPAKVVPNGWRLA